MDQGSKGSLKIVLVLIVLAIIAYFAFFAKRGDSLEQSGRVYEESNTAYVSDRPCIGSVYNFSSNSCFVESCGPGGTSSHTVGGQVTNQEATTCGATLDTDSAEYIAGGANEPDTMICLALACTGGSNYDNSDLFANNIKNNQELPNECGNFKKVLDDGSNCSMVSCSGNVTTSQGGVNDGEAFVDCGGVEDAGGNFSYQDNDSETMDCLALACIGNIIFDDNNTNTTQNKGDQSSTTQGGTKATPTR